MSTSSAGIEQLAPCKAVSERVRWSCWPKAAVAGFFLLAGASLGAAPAVGEWVPYFKGVELSVSTNAGIGDGFRNLQVVYALRIDLTDPDIRLLTTPPFTNYVARSREVGGLTVSDFLRTNRVQAAINANFFSPGTYYLPAGTPMNVYGVAVSQGTVVSETESRGHAAAILFDAMNRPAVIPTNWPTVSLEGVETAVCGDYPLVVAGKNVISPSARGAEPRTVFGVSEDRRYLYLVAIDGRQDGYSEGANDYESANWLLLLGAFDGINLDGGGSTTLVVEDSTGVPVRLNRSSAVADSGRERTVGSHFGVYAKPLPAFVNDVTASAEDTTATITWTTLAPATSELEYGPTLEFGARSGVQAELATSHVVYLSGLTPDTDYFFRVHSSTSAESYVSRNFSFRTAGYGTAISVFGLEQVWRFKGGAFQDLSWTAPDYEDSGWDGSGPGLLWTDVRAAGPNPAVEPKSTLIPVDPATGFPYLTYYFRTRFYLDGLGPAAALLFSGFIDDGAVFYLNGREMHRLRMPEISTAETLASGFACDGDATCPDEFKISGALLDSLRPGENVLAVEVHNYNVRSADATFGLTLTRLEPGQRPVALAVEYSANVLTLRWTEAGFTLQSAASPLGPWTDLAADSAFTTPATEAHRYFRLRK